MSRNDLVENGILYVLGGISGAALGSLVLSLNMISVEAGRSIDILIIAALLGIIVAVSIRDYKGGQTHRASQKVWGQAVALIAHEMRTNLTSMSWAIQLVLQNYGDKISEEDRKMLESTVSSIKTTVAHSANLLDINKLSISLEWTALADVKKILKEIVEKFTEGAKRAGIEVISDIRLDAQREVEIDLRRLRIILENLLENAIQYTVGAQKVVTITITNDETDMHLSVRDTGIGIPEKEKAKIFSEFFRASNARKVLSSGSGIGLYMCAQYIQAHKGTIRFDSKEGEGTTFYVSLPLKEITDLK